MMVAQTKKKRGVKFERLLCNECHRKTLHKVLKDAHDTGSEPYDDGYHISWHIIHEMLECCGCKSVILRKTHHFSEWDYPDVRFFPPPVSRRKPKWFYDIPNELRSLLEEIYNSLNANTTALPLMGARAVLDKVIVNKVGDVGTFAEKLKNLETHGFISQKNREVLDAALDAGSAAAHRGYAPKLADVQTVMDIVENLLQSLYVLDKAAADIKKSTPPRPAVKKKATTP
jgi:hypothetical protein